MIQVKAQVLQLFEHCSHFPVLSKKPGLQSQPTLFLLATLAQDEQVLSGLQVEHFKGHSIKVHFP